MFIRLEVRKEEKVEITLGQLFTATITNFERCNKTAFAVSFISVVETINFVKQATREMQLLNLRIISPRSYCI
jgi:hypothetical protein